MNSLAFDPQDQVIAQAFKESAFGAQLHRGTCWIVYSSNGTATVVAAEELGQLPKCEWRSDQLYTVPAPADDPKASYIQEMADKLEKIVEAPVTSFEIKSNRWIGRMATAWLGYKDVTDWHEAATKEALVKELIDAYA